MWQVGASLPEYCHSFPLALPRGYPYLIVCRSPYLGDPVAVRLCRGSHQKRQYWRQVLALSQTALFSARSSRQLRGVKVAVRGEALLSASIGEAFRGIGCHDDLKDTDHSQIKASNQYSGGMRYSQEHVYFGKAGRIQGIVLTQPWPWLLESIASSCAS